MNRKELVELLNHYPEDADVVVETPDNDFWFTPVSNVELSDVKWKDGDKVRCITKCIVIQSD